METVLTGLFDFQKFEGNWALQQVIDSVRTRYAVRELDLDEMMFVAAVILVKLLMLPPISQRP